MCLAVLAEAGRVLFGRNLHVVVANRVYRCAQLSGDDLAQVVGSRGIRTVVNLRGSSDPAPWYLEESRATHSLGVAQEDICFSAGRLPATHEIRRLVEVLDRTQYPILLHCRRGADRTGLASATVLLLQSDVAYEIARRQLGLRYGHVRVGRPAILDQFLELYEEWLASCGIIHAPEAFRRWLLHDYCPGERRCILELLDMPAWVPCGHPWALRVRTHNTGIKPWRLRPGTGNGISAGLVLWNSEGQLQATSHAGLFDAEVSPGQSIDLTLAVPSLPPGRYRLLVDMRDDQQTWFYQTGSEPLEHELEVR